MILFTLDLFEATVLLLWIAGVIFVGWGYFLHRSANRLIMLLVSLCIPGFGICYAAVQAVQKLTLKKNLG
ncbi:MULTISPECIES: hypothetical protein [Micrococcaceae]|uniref:hypothetical protein n=1 Tax=Micrococcaceae TaxID=1268 RepID=UPI0010367C67|nr:MULTISPECIES: hypothetical protein [Micrococcaceae]TAP28817.1 hypothetical protein EYR88_11235 [Arthrobacter sp. S41]UXN32335.1 hypothetical protein N6V40_02290 [Glutamicibacter sp. M10]